MPITRHLMPSKICGKTENLIKIQFIATMKTLKNKKTTLNFKNAVISLKKSLLND
ncbi:hypothetical protein COTS27_00296 [Spirochaetota bacterium]|nr:hypothetical protein COTS27_00296 [Spirochaetota bacterium]